MKTKNFLLCCMVCVIHISCQEKTLDLATIKLGESAEKYKLDKSSIFEKAPFRSSENVIAYDSNKEYGFTFEEIPTDSSSVVWLTVANNKIASIEIYIDIEYSLHFAEKLLMKLGTPTAIFVEETYTDPEIGRQIFNRIHAVFPDSTQWTGSDYTFKYPYCIFWEKENIYYIYLITVDGNTDIRNRYYPVTKEAFRTGKVFGYPYPLPKESPLSDYMK